MARGEAEQASGSSAIRLVSALQQSKCPEFKRPAQGRHWMAHGGYLFSVALRQR
jgi:hypothetical protein